MVRSVEKAVKQGPPEQQACQQPIARQQLAPPPDAFAGVIDPTAIGPWFVTPNEAFDSLKPLEIIARGEIDRLWDMAYCLRSGMPG